MKKRKVVGALVVGAIVTSSIVSILLYSMKREESVINVVEVEHASWFTPMKIDSNLTITDYEFDTESISIVQGNKVYTMDIPSIDVLNTYGDGVYALDGSFYIAVAKNESINFTPRKIEQDLGFNGSRVFEYIFGDTIIYVKCYSSDVYSYFSDLDISNIAIKNATFDYSLDVSKISATQDLSSVTDMLNKPSNEDKYITIDEDMRNIIEDNTEAFDGIKNTAGSKYKVSSYKGIGNTTDEFVVECFKLMDSGYNLYKDGIGYTTDGYLYAQFDKVILVMKNRTNNSFLVYYFI